MGNDNPAQKNLMKPNTSMALSFHAGTGKATAGILKTLGRIPGVNFEVVPARKSHPGKPRAALSRLSLAAAWG